LIKRGFDYVLPDVGIRHSERSVSEVEELLRNVSVDKEGFDYVLPKGTAPLPHSDPFGALSLALPPRHSERRPDIFYRGEVEELLRLIVVDTGPAWIGKSQFAYQ